MTPEAIKRFCKAFSVFVVAVGGVGSLVCVPYAMTSSLQLITIAGIYFIAGAIMIVGGLISYVGLINAE